jgi:ATP-binding cassette subfamily B multidrug efflux pump
VGTLSTLAPYVWRYRRDLALGIIFSFAVYAMAFINPWLLGVAIDGLTNGQATHAWFLARYALLMVGVLACAQVFSFLQHWRLFLVGNRVEFDYRNDFFAHLQSLEPAYFQETKTGDIVALATNDLAVIRTLVGAGSINLLSITIAMLTGLTLMFVLDARLALPTMLILPCITVIYLVLAGPNRRRFERMQEQYGVLSSTVQENIAGVRVVKAYAQEDAEIRNFGDLCGEYTRCAKSYMRLSGVLWPLMSALFGLAVMTMLLVGGTDVIHHRLTLGQLFQFNGYLMMLNWPVIGLGWLITIIGQADGALNRLNAVLDREPAIADRPGAAPLQAIEGRIQMEHVALTLNDTHILEDINVLVPAGTSLGIVGAIGSGKSSLIQMLMRLTDPRHGRILLDGVDLRQITLESLRRTIGFVPQETLLFSETLAENILYGVEHGSSDLVVKASTAAHLQHDVGGFPAGYETMLGERGITLSGGQKQRAALARAFAKDPRILILDDALSAVDTHTEAEILANLRSMMVGRTTVIVSHRLSTLRHCDQLIVLEKGRIVEQGTHDSLLALDGLYAAMDRRQRLAVVTGESVG